MASVQMSLATLVLPLPKESVSQKAITATTIFFSISLHSLARLMLLTYMINWACLVLNALHKLPIYSAVSPQDNTVQCAWSCFYTPFLSFWFWI